MKEENCRNCRYFNCPADEVVGQCRYYPPEPMQPGTYPFPKIDHNEWCGKFKAKKEALPAADHKFERSMYCRHCGQLERDHETKTRMFGETY